MDRDARSPARGRARCKPLFTFIKDKKAGDTSGDGVKHGFHIAKP
ncbi:hypothetical protein ABZY31_24290 [Streptomyces sp. NPDC006529]